MYYQRGGRLARDNFVKKGPSIQDQLTTDQIQEKLQNYVQVDDIDLVHLNTHVRYFVKQSGGGKEEYKFRTGGFLKKKDNPKYVVLSNSPDQNGQTWSVNRDTAVFYRIKSRLERVADEKDAENEELLGEYQTTLKKQQAEIKRLRQELKRQKGK